MILPEFNFVLVKSKLIILWASSCLIKRLNRNYNCLINSNLLKHTKACLKTNERKLEVYYWKEENWISTRWRKVAFASMSRKQYFKSTIDEEKWLTKQILFRYFLSSTRRWNFLLWNAVIHFIFICEFYMSSGRERSKYPLIFQLLGIQNKVRQLASKKLWLGHVPL